MSNPFRYFNSSPEVIRLVVMMYVRYPLSLRNVEDLLAERAIDVSHETVRFWWNRFGPMFAAEIRKRRAAHMRGFIQWRWHLDEAFVKINGKLRYLWRAVDHEGEVLDAVVTSKRNKAAALKPSQADYEEIRPTADDRHRRAARLFRGDERGRQRGSPGGRRSGQQSCGEFTSAVSTTRESHAAVSKHEVAAEVQLSSRPGPQLFQSGAPSRYEASLQTKTLGRVGGVGRTRGVDRRLRAGMSRHAQTTAVTLTKPGVAFPAPIATTAERSCRRR
jgi:DDE domain